MDSNKHILVNAFRIRRNIKKYDIYGKQIKIYKLYNSYTLEYY